MEKFEGTHNKDPHAHVIRAPGPRLMHHVPLRFVWNKVSGQQTRSPNAALNLVSFIDFLVVTVIFLLSAFSASGSPCVEKQVNLPRAENVQDLVDAPMVAVSGGQILVDGVQAGSVRSVEETGHLQKLDELFHLLRTKRELFRQIQPNKTFPGVAILQVDGGVPAIVVKSVFQTAAYAGYSNISFLVAKLPMQG
jgi:biopolymer transport protein ExbD